jgi:tRNA-dihydrouridine synthase B
MIGRGSQGNPWIFNEVLSYLESSTLPESVSLEEKINMVITQAKMMIEQKGEYLAIREMRKHLIWYLKGMRDASKYKLMANQVSTFNELIEITNRIKENIK